MQKVEKPVLIGLGGSGSHIVSKVTSRFKEKDYNFFLKAICLDSDDQDLRRNDCDLKIRVSSSEKPHEIISRLPIHNEARIVFEDFFGKEPPPEIISKMSLMDGASSIYELSWLGFEAKKEKILERISQYLFDLDVEPTRYIIAGSLCGATSAAILPRISKLLLSASSEVERKKNVVAVALSKDCYIQANFFPVSMVKAFNRNEALSLNDIAKNTNHFDKIYRIGADSHETASFDEFRETAVQIIAAELDGHHDAYELPRKSSLILSDGNMLINLPEIPDFIEKSNDTSNEINSRIGGAALELNDEDTQKDDSRSIPKAIYPKNIALRSILSTNPEEFTKHIQQTIDVLQTSIREQERRKPNDSIELRNWEHLLATLNISCETLTTLQSYALDINYHDSIEKNIPILSAGFEKAINNLKSGCKYLDEETKGNGHYAKLHKIGICMSLGGILSIASGAPVIVAAAGVGAMFYGKDFGKSVFGLFAKKSIDE